MASISNPQVTHGGTSTSMGQNVSGEIGSPISNEAYDVLTALQSKLEGLEAYRKYAKDGNDTLWQELSRADQQCVDRLVGELERMVKEGTFRRTKRPSSNA